MTCNSCGAPTCPNDERDWDKFDHNLVLAAPELLNTLKMLAGMCHENDSGMGYADITVSKDELLVIRTVIAKAEGRGE